MYSLINVHINLVLQAIPLNEVGDYVRLKQNLGQAGTQTFQNDYRAYWKAQLRHYPLPQWNVYWTPYFQELQTAVQTQTVPNLKVLVTNLYNVTPSRGKNKPSLEFSFATKLLHMVKPQSPIFDRWVAHFYFYQNPYEDWQKRLDHLLAFHAFLGQEYRRILTKRLLGSSIAAFGKKFPNYKTNVTDERVVDLLIWAYAKIAGRELMRSIIIYS